MAPTTSGGQGHWGALTTANRAPLPTRIFYFHNDLNGAPEELTDSSGEIIWHTRYRVFGNTVQEAHEASAITRQNIRFQGQYLDRETGLHYNTHRYYDPDIGRFTTPDPIGLAGGLNQYQYAPNPIMWIDPWGWACLSNKKTGTAREKRYRTRMERALGKDRVLSERYLRDSNGKISKDPETGKGRRIDFLVMDKNGKWKPREITSRTAIKDAQINKEIRIRKTGGIYARNNKTGELIEVDGISEIIRLK